MTFARGLIVTILPISSQISSVRSFEVFLDKAAFGLQKDSKAMAQQIRTISKERVTGECVGVLDKKMMSRVDAAIRLHLGV